MSDLVPIKAASGLVPTTMAEVMELSELMAKSEMVPKIYQNKPGNVVVAILAGHPLGLNPFAACQSFAVINGTPSLFGDALLGIVKGSGLLPSIKESISDDGQVATCYIQRRGEDIVCRTFTMDEAKKAGLLTKQGPWQAYPKRMLQMRARAFALRDVFPDILRGIGIAEEQEDVAVAAAATIVVEQPKNLGAGAVKAALQAANEEPEVKVAAKASTKTAAAIKAVEPEPEQEQELDPTPEVTTEVDPEPEDFGDKWRAKLKGIPEPAKGIAKRMFDAWRRSDRDAVEKIVLEEFPSTKWARHADLVALSDFADDIGRDIAKDAQ